MRTANNTQNMTCEDLPRIGLPNFRPTAIRLALCGLAVGFSLPALAIDNNSHSTSKPTEPLVTTIPNADQVQPIQAQSNQAQPNQAQPSQRNQPYQYQLPSQPIADHISQQLANQTLTPDFNNFNQPVATLKQNQPTVGFNASIANNAQAVDNSTKPLDPDKAINSQKALQQAQVVEQLTTDKPTIQADPELAKQNATHQTDDINVTDSINPNDYLPEYQQQTASVSAPQAQSTVTADSPNLLKRVYNRVLNRTQGANYLDITIANADDAQQPAKNIKAALEQVTVDSVTDFAPSINRLRQIALDAAEAVGYYDAEVSFKHLGGDNIEVTLKAGEPVTVKNRIVDIRGAGAEGDSALPVYAEMKESLPPKVGDVFNHGAYKASKAMIEGVALTNGFFDGEWLNNSADIILPDNTADVDLVYDTKGRYQFGDVKIYSIDKDGKLNDDPAKLPLKPELLQQLMTYRKGEPYHQPFVTKFANNLSATRYFNAVDMDVVLPSDGATADIRFATNSPTSTPNTPETSTPETSTTENSITNVKTDNNIHDVKTNSADKLANNAVVDNNEADNLSITSVTENQSTDNSPQRAVQNPEDIAPINFDIDATTQERLKAIKNKADNLLHAPEDIQLAPEEQNNSKNPLVVVTNAVTQLAKKIDSHSDDTPLQLAQAQQQDPIDKLTPQQVYQQKSVPTYVVLNAAKPREAQIGLGYETDVGVRVVGKWENNLVNRNGLQAGVSVGVSKVEQSLEASASYPYKHPLTDKLTGVVGYQHSNSKDVANTFETESLYANVARNIYRDSGWNRTYSLRYRTDKLTLGDDGYTIENLPYPFNNNASDITQQSLLLGYALSKTVADNILSPTYGYSQRYSAEVGADGVLTDTNMAILRAGVTGLYSFGDNNKHQALGRLDLGYIYSDDFYHVPYRLRFFAGGDQSVRGYANNSLSPKYGSDDFLIGGDALAVGSLEYSYLVREGLRAALFTDVGNAYDLSGDNPNSTKVGVGAGIRWASPIGTVRLDLASGLSDGGDPIRLYFFIGSPL